MEHELSFHRDAVELDLKDDLACEITVFHFDLSTFYPSILLQFSSPDNDNPIKLGADHRRKQSTFFREFCCYFLAET